MKHKIAVITSDNKLNYMTETLVDGLLQLREEGTVEFHISSKSYLTEYPSVKSLALKREEFKKFATKEADLIILIWTKGLTDFKLAHEIGRWDKTVFVDASELGRDRRYDQDIQQQILSGTWVDNGKIDKEMLDRCALYFRREKPYINGIIPLPFGIESRYSQFYSPAIKKDIDFVCIFGQEEYPILRKNVREYLEIYCQENGFKCVTQKTKSKEEFYKILARAKVGISVGGGGYDTARFWEILGNNCLLLTEKIDIYEPGSDELQYKHIWEFGDFHEFKGQLDKLSEFLKSSYNQGELLKEYSEIMFSHDSKSRVLKIIKEAESRSIISGAEFKGEQFILGMSTRMERDTYARYNFALSFVQNKETLDISCGSGFGTSILKKKGRAKRVDGVDTSQEIIDYAQKHYAEDGLSFSVGDIADFGDNETYDVVTCFETIGFVPDYTKALRNIYRILRPGGILIVSTPNRKILSPNNKSLEDKPAGSRYFKNHLREFVLDEIVVKLRESRFSVDSDDLWGSRQQYYFRNKYMRRLYKFFCKPDNRSNPNFERIFSEPRFFIIVAHKTNGQ